MHENTYILKTMFAGAVDLYTIKAHSQKQALEMFHDYLENEGINPTAYGRVYIQLVGEGVTLFHSYNLGEG